MAVVDAKIHSNHHGTICSQAIAYLRELQRQDVVVEKEHSTDAVAEDSSITCRKRLARTPLHTIGRVSRGLDVL
eukprot:692073-Amphidinium_carterae.1